MSFFNQYSYFVIGGIVLLITAYLILRREQTLPRILGVAGLAALFLGIWFLIRPEQTPHTGAAELQAQIGAGTPVLLEFQSPY
jgi:multisubunit Na+/H+ antiporter MnhB subunit